MESKTQDAPAGTNPAKGKTKKDLPETPAPAEDLKVRITADEAEVGSNVYRKGDIVTLNREHADFLLAQGLAATAPTTDERVVKVDVVQQFAWSSATIAKGQRIAMPESDAEAAQKAGYVTIVGL